MTQDPEDQSDQLAREYRKRCLQAWVNAASRSQRNDLVVLLLDRTDATAQGMLDGAQDAYENVDSRVAIGVVTRADAQTMLHSIGEPQLATGLEAHPAPTVCTIVFAYDMLNVVGWTNAVGAKAQVWELTSRPSNASPQGEGAEGGS
jgi:hypothetical protein